MSAPRVKNTRAEVREPLTPFLPDLCNSQAVFLLVLVAELLALLLTISAPSGLRNFNWDKLALVSVQVQWIVLCSAIALCRMRFWLARQTQIKAGSVSYALVLLITLVLSLVGQWIIYGVSDLVLVVERPVGLDYWLLVDNLALAAILSGILLRYLYLQQQLRNQQQAEMQARIQALQSRIRPHFLFNTLNMLAELTQQDPSKAEQAILDLAKLFRAALQSHSLVSLTDEFALARKYIALEQLRLGERLQLQWHVPESLQMLQIPGLTLQPLLENAVRYGIEPSQHPALLTVLVEVGRSQCSVTIRNQIWPNVEHGKGNGIALQNIKHRLQLFYGDAAALTVHQQQGQFITKLTLPLTKDAH